jgi:hypothetical protein
MVLLYGEKWAGGADADGGGGVRDGSSLIGVDHGWVLYPAW